MMASTLWRVAVVEAYDGPVLGWMVVYGGGWWWMRRWWRVGNDANFFVTH